MFRCVKLREILSPTYVRNSVQTLEFHRYRFLDKKQAVSVLQKKGLTSFVEL